MAIPRVHTVRHRTASPHEPRADAGRALVTREHEPRGGWLRLRSRHGSGRGPGRSRTGVPKARLAGPHLSAHQQETNPGFSAALVSHARWGRVHSRAMCPLRVLRQTQTEQQAGTGRTSENGQTQTRQDVGQREPHPLLAGDRAAPWVVSHKTDPTLTTPTNQRSYPWCPPTGVEDLRSHKNRHVGVYA